MIDRYSRSGRAAVRLSIGAIVFMSAGAIPAVGAEYPQCILDGLKGNPQAQWGVVYNVTKMCLKREETILPQSDIAGLHGYGVWAVTSLGEPVWQITLTNDTPYILTEISIQIVVGENLRHEFISDGFDPVFHGAGIVGPSFNVVGDRTIRPGETREFSIAAPGLPNPVKSTWNITSVKGIPA